MPNPSVKHQWVGTKQAGSRSRASVARAHVVTHLRSWRGQGERHRARAAPPRWCRPPSRTAQPFERRGEGAQRLRGMNRELCRAQPITSIERAAHAQCQGGHIDQFVGGHFFCRALLQSRSVALWVLHWPRSPVLLGCWMQNGLQKRIETAEGYLPVTPVVGCIPEDVEQLLPGFLVELHGGRNLLQHHNESPAVGPICARGRSCSRTSASKFLPKCAGKVNCPAIMSSTSCLLCAWARLAYRKVVAHGSGRILQILHAEGANGLHDVGTYATQGRFQVFTKWCLHLRYSF